MHTVPAPQYCADCQIPQAQVEKELSERHFIFPIVQDPEDPEVDVEGAELVEDGFVYPVVIDCIGAAPVVIGFDGIFALPVVTG